ncbi:hypothetical protein PDESU_03351 [Pontiella desulfatans]|uniref:Uncharacterized protein n=1 Tax=Pontiella desulfatans TaxID=2750659 RepID=A0A6C2U425_PONDE|nr:hypothetical protein [Pontiella desulfatans]VGO14782.1 hypothetical protein PDESU_03351 [Pontiella desulfatans]
MAKKKKPFFAKHAKSSAAMVSLGIHAAIILAAASFVAFKVIVKEEKVFVAKENKRPKMKLKKLQVPIKMEKRKKQTAKLRKRVVAKNPRRTQMDITMPEITGVMGGMGAMDVSGGLGGDIGFNIPEINFFGVKKKSEKVVFVVLAGPASTNGSNGYQSPKSRMCFYTLRARLNDMVQSLPEYALFNATFFMSEITTPFSTNMLLATQENKDLLVEWGSTVNPLELEETYGPGNNYEGFWAKYITLDWENGDRWEGEDLPPVYPKWLYRYEPGPRILKHFPKNGVKLKKEFEHWNKAVCFAFEQKPDTIFILTTNYIGEEPGVLTQSFMDICTDIYGPDRKRFPTINVVVLTRPGQNAEGASNVLDTYISIINKFRGKGEIINDIRDHMTVEEKAAMEKLEGTF